MPLTEVDARVCNGDLVILGLNEERKLVVQKIDGYGSSVATPKDNEEAIDIFKHTALYTDRFVMETHDWSPENFIYDAEIGELVPK